MCGAAAELRYPPDPADSTVSRVSAVPPSAAAENSEAEAEGTEKEGQETEEKTGPESKANCCSSAACGNLRLLTRRHATLRMGVSEISGWGVFSTRALERDEFVYEYMGEVISHDEADRRGSIYDKFNHSFLFNLNSATVVDAGRKGNKVQTIIFIALYSYNPSNWSTCRHASPTIHRGPTATHESCLYTANTVLESMQRTLSPQGMSSFMTIDTNMPNTKAYLLCLTGFDADDKTFASVSDCLPSV